MSVSAVAVMRVMMVVCLSVLVTVSAMAALPPDVLMALKAPDKPDSFNDIAEFSRYLDELKQYYSIVGRPRWVHVCLSTNNK